MVSGDEKDWVTAGGDASHLAIYRRVGDMATFADGDSRCLAGRHPALPEVGAVGDWVGGDAVREAAEAWLRGKGVRVLRAPMALCTWFPYRALVGPLDQPRFLFEPTEGPQRWEAAGYQTLAHYTSVLLPHKSLMDVVAPRAVRLRAEGWTVRPLGWDAGPVSEEVFREAVASMHGVVHSAFAGALGFAPVSVQVMQDWYAPYRPFVDPRLVQIVRTPDGEVAAFAFGVPDVLAPERGWFLVKTAAVSARFQGTGVGTWASAEAGRAARELGYTGGVYALMWEGAPSQRWARHGGEEVGRYVLLEKSAS